MGKKGEYDFSTEIHNVEEVKLILLYRLLELWNNFEVPEQVGLHKVHFGGSKDGGKTVQQMVFSFCFVA